MSAARARSAPASMASPGPGQVHKIAPYGGGLRLDSYLSRYLTERSRAQWQRLIESGTVTLNGRQVRPSARVAPEDRIEIKPVAAFALLEPDPAIPLDIVYEDASMVVINKPSGLVVHPAPGHQSGTLVHALLARFPELNDPTGSQRPGIVHRLDKDTSGLMVVGKTLEAVTALQRQMVAGSISKRYRILVLGEIEEDRAIIEVPIGRDQTNRQKMAARVDGRPARTEFRVLERFPGYTLVDASLPSGRTHQLRVHFAYIRHPVAGDRIYGSGRGPKELSRQFVHSHELALVSPATGEELRLTAELPPDLAQVLEGLRVP